MTRDRHAWLFKAADYVRRCRRIDRLAGIEWEDAGPAEQAPAKK